MPNIKPGTKVYFVCNNKVNEGVSVTNTVVKWLAYPEKGDLGIREHIFYNFYLNRADAVKELIQDYKDYISYNEKKLKGYNDILKDIKRFKKELKLLEKELKGIA